MTGADLQRWLGAHGQPVLVDGRPGPITRKAIVAAFTNNCAPKITPAEIGTLAARLGCTSKQLQALASVESGGAAFDGQGRPKILFERHKFHEFTGGCHSVCSFSNPSGGGYAEDSWVKLTAAACLDADAGFKATSWGKFQVLAMHWQALGYPSPLDMAYSTVTGEAAHYDMLARYIEKNGLKGPLARLSTDPADNEPLAKGYNGPGFKRFDYHTKLARAML